MAVKPGSGAPPEEAIRLLVAWIEGIEKRMAEADSRLTTESLTRQREGATLTDQINRAEKRLKLSATGGLSLSAVGIFWLVIGTVLTTFSVEIASLFPAAIQYHESTLAEDMRFCAMLAVCGAGSYPTP
ncbi:MAG: hypothetical protein JSR67_12970 [Proteobacteria bacterium]|nr:hypothetical protein [Pseudomonadota bacterium]